MCNTLLIIYSILLELLVVVACFGYVLPQVQALSL